MNVSRFGIARIAAFILPAIIALAACAPQPTPTAVPPTVAPTQAPTAVPPTAAPTQPPATSAPPGPVARITKFEVTNPPAQIDLVLVVGDFGPGAVTPQHTHGGQGYATVLEGEITIRSKDGEKKYKAGETFLENTNEVFQAANTSGAKASVLWTFLLPKGAPLQTNLP